VYLFIGLLAIWLIGCWLIGLLTIWPIGLLTIWPIGLLAYLLFGLLACWLLAYWLFGYWLLAVWPIGCWLIGYLAIWNPGEIIWQKFYFTKLFIFTSKFTACCYLKLEIYFVLKALFSSKMACKRYF